VGQIQHGADTFWGQAFPNPQCRLCDAPEETLEHILNQCPALNQIRSEAAVHVLDTAMQIWEMTTPPPNFLAPQLHWRFPPRVCAGAALAGPHADMERVAWRFDRGDGDLHAAVCEGPLPCQ
jgi:hypothetical protein